jgi:hypothetical protein
VHIATNIRQFETTRPQTYISNKAAPPQGPEETTSERGLGTALAVGGLAAAALRRYWRKRQQKYSAAAPVSPVGPPYIPVAQCGTPGSRLIIHAAIYADKDVTNKVRSLLTPDQVFSLHPARLNDEFGDPWPNNGRKMFNVLYQYGDRPMEVWAGR